MNLKKRTICEIPKCKDLFIVNGKMQGCIYQIKAHNYIKQVDLEVQSIDDNML